MPSKLKLWRAWKKFLHAAAWHLWRQLHTELCPCGAFASSIARKCGKYQRKRAFWGSGHVPLFWSYIDINPNHPKLEPSCAVLEPSWAEVGANWSKLGRSWGLAGRSWPQVEPMLRPCRFETAHLDDFGPICKLRKLPQFRALFGTLLCRICFFSAEVAPVNRGLFESIGSAPLGALCAGGFLFSIVDGPHWLIPEGGVGTTNQSTSCWL